jgi:hypothetical protein
MPKDDTYNHRWSDIAINTVEKCTKEAIDHTETEVFTYLGNEGQPGVQINVIMKNGDAYDVTVRFSDGMVFTVQYTKSGHDPTDSMW